MSVTEVSDGWDHANAKTNYTQNEGIYYTIKTHGPGLRYWTRTRFSAGNAQYVGEWCVNNGVESDTAKSHRPGLYTNAICLNPVIRLG